MDLGVISLIVSVSVASGGILKYLRNREISKETDVSDELEQIKKDIIDIKIENGKCSVDRCHNNESIREQVKLLERLNDKLDNL